MLIAAKWCIPKYQLLSSFLLSCSVDVLGGKLFELTGSDDDDCFYYFQK